MSSTASVSLFTRSETDHFSFLLQHAFENNYAVAVWKLPNDNTRHLLISRKHQPIKRDAVVLEELPAGFIFSPFDRTKDALFLEADYLFAFKDARLKAPETPKATESLTWLEEVLHAKANQRHRPYTSSAHTVNVDEASFLKLVELGVKEIEQERLEKIVPSRTQTISLGADFDIVDAFQRLCLLYPNALVSFVSTPETGSWLGASPESLVTVEHKSIFRTVALAGTKPYQEGINLKAVAWTQKEIEEQALVERYVISCFKKIRVREYDEHGPKTVIAGNLMHLRSDFTVDMREINFPQLGSVMLQLLHPTSAVCGMPLEPALAFLKRHEGYDREFYAGFLGPVNIDDNIHIFVNLRCMKLIDGGAVLFAGAGVTADSIPENEWSETEIKFNTLLNAVKPIGG